MSARAQHPGHTVHLVQRGRGACFLCDSDRTEYLRCLVGLLTDSRCAVHAYVLMSNHVHLLATPARAGAVSDLAHALGERHSRYMRETHGDGAPPWRERSDTGSVHAGRHVLLCMRYIELNPVRAWLVGHPRYYRWSSYPANGLGEEDAILAPHPVYVALGRTAASRQAAYRVIVAARSHPGTR